MPTVSKNIAINKLFSKVNQEYIFDLPPIRDIGLLNTFALNLFGVTSNRLLEITYQISLNGGLKFVSNWSSSLPLPYTIPVKTDLVIQIKAKRIGSDESGVITFGSVDFSGDSSAAHQIQPIFNNTIFENVVGDYWESLWVNLLKKLYSDGILPQFVERGEDIDDIDLIQYITFLSKFYALLGATEDKYIVEFSNDKTLLSDFLRQKTALFCDEIALQDLIFVKSNFTDEIRQRGTHMIHQKSNYSIDNGVTTKGINGELLRYICFQEGDEFLFEFLNTSDSGWTVDGVTCPNYFGNTGRPQLNKSPNKTKDANLNGFMVNGDVEVVLYGDKSLCVNTSGNNLNTESADSILVDSIDHSWTVFKINYTNTSVEITNDAILLENSENFLTQNNEVMILEESSEISSGSSESLSSIQLLIDIDSSLSYELTFQVKSDAFLKSIPTGNSFSVSCMTSNSSGVLTVNRFINGDVENTNSKYFIQSGSLLNDNWLYVKCIIYGYDFDGVNLQDRATNIGIGSNIQIVDKTTSKVKFSIINDSLSAEPIYIYDVKVVPLYLDKNSCFVDNFHTANMVWKNNNNVKNVEEMVGDINKYLMPYNTNFLHQILNRDGIQQYLLSDTAGDFINTESNKKIINKI